MARSTPDGADFFDGVKGEASSEGRKEHLPECQANS